MQFRIFLSVLVLALLVSGCATMDSGASAGTGTLKALDVALALKFEDVPVPAGFKAIGNDSFVFQNDLLRVGILKYSGSAYANQVINFYKDQMPLYNWRFLNIVEYGRSILNFDREDQTCVIIVEPAKLCTYVTVTVAPKAGRGRKL